MFALLSTFLLLVVAQDPIERAKALLEKLDADDVSERETAVRELKSLAPESIEVDQCLEKSSRPRNAEVRERVQSVLGDRQLFRQSVGGCSSGMSH